MHDESPLSSEYADGSIGPRPTITGLGRKALRTRDLRPSTRAWAFTRNARTAGPLAGNELRERSLEVHRFRRSGCVDDDCRRPGIHASLHQISCSDRCLRDIITASKAVSDAVGADRIVTRATDRKEFVSCLGGEPGGLAAFLRADPGCIEDHRFTFLEVLSGSVEKFFVHSGTGPGRITIGARCSTFSNLV